MNIKLNFVPDDHEPEYGYYEIFVDGEKTVYSIQKDDGLFMIHQHADIEHEKFITTLKIFKSWERIEKSLKNLLDNS